jgi:hypothetical protein
MLKLTENGRERERERERERTQEWNTENNSDSRTHYSWASAEDTKHIHTSVISGYGDDNVQLMDVPCLCHVPHRRPQQERMKPDGSELCPAYMPTVPHLLPLKREFSLQHDQCLFFLTEISPDKRPREPTTIEAMIKPCDDTNYCCLESHASFHWKASLRIASLSFPKNYAREIP